MKFIVCSLLMIFVVFAATWVFFVQSDANLDIARSIACMQASREGKPEVIHSLVGTIRDKYALAAAKTYLAACENDESLTSKFGGSVDSELLDFELVRRAILDAPGYSDELEIRIKRMPFSVKKAVAYALIADKAAESGDFNAYGRLMDGAYFLALAFDPVKSENEVFQIMDILAAREDAERLVEFAKRLFYSNELVLHIYSYGRIAKIAEYFSMKSADNEFKAQNKILAQLMWRSSVLSEINNMTYEKLEQSMAYTAIKFNMTWAIKNWEAYKYPLLAYVSRIAGNEEFYRHYKKLSLSEKQLRDMRAGLFQYVEYAANAFAMAGDPEASAVLLRALPDGRQKNLSIKRVIRSMVSAPGGLDIVLRENLL